MICKFGQYYSMIYHIKGFGVQQVREDTYNELDGYDLAEKHLICKSGVGLFLREPVSFVERSDFSFAMNILNVYLLSLINKFTTPAKV